MNYLRLIALALVISSLLIFTIYEYKSQIMLSITKPRVLPPKLLPPPRVPVLHVVTTQTEKVWKGHVLSEARAVYEDLGSKYKVTYTIKVKKYPNVISVCVYAYYMYVDENYEWKYKVFANGETIYAGSSKTYTFYIDKDDVERYGVFIVLYNYANSIISGYRGPIGWIIDDVDLIPKPKGKIDVPRKTFNFFDQNVKIYLNKRVLDFSLIIDWTCAQTFEYEDPDTGEKSRVRVGITVLDVYVNGEHKIHKEFEDYEYWYDGRIKFPSDGVYNVEFVIRGEGWDWKSKTFTVLSTLNYTKQVIPIDYDVLRVLIYLIGLFGLLTTFRDPRVGVVLGVTNIILVLLVLGVVLPVVLAVGIVLLIVYVVYPRVKQCFSKIVEKVRRF